MWPSTIWSLSSLTRNIVLGSASTISPSISIFSSLAMRAKTYQPWWSPNALPLLLAPDLGRDGRQLGRVCRLGQPRQLERIVRVARDHVDVKVEDRLPCRAPHVVQDVEARRVERLLQAIHHSPRGIHRR